MVPHTPHLSIVRVLHAKLDSKTAGGKESPNIRLYSARSFCTASSPNLDELSRPAEAVSQHLPLDIF